MDREDPDTDAVRRFELFEVVLETLLNNDAELYAKLGGPSGVKELMRHALINAAIQQGDAISKAIVKSYPGIDVVQLVNDMRVGAVTIRLGGEI